MSSSPLPLRVLIEHLLDEAVDRWHETDPTEQRSLAQWLGVSDESFTDWVMSADPADLRPRDPEFYARYLRQAVDR